MIPKGRSLAMGLAIAAWLALVASGFAFWEKYETTPGQIHRSEDAAHPSLGKWEFVLFVHPHCPCTRATIQELAELVQRAGPNVLVRVVFVRPEDAPTGWERSELWNAAAAIPGVQVSCDEDGSEAHRAGAATSGHLVVYDPTGRVAFHGGITRGRGQAGESPGREAILSLLAGSEPASRQTPVFGCELFSRDRCDDKVKGTPCPK
jgi:hypothetical protein